MICFFYNMVRFLLFFISIYQLFVSPMLLSNCRFFPRCSVYFRKSLIKYGFFYGFCLIFRRLFKCNPFCKGGYDPVP